MQKADDEFEEEEEEEDDEKEQPEETEPEEGPPLLTSAAEDASELYGYDPHANLYPNIHNHINRRLIQQLLP